MAEMAETETVTEPAVTETAPPSHELSAVEAAARIADGSLSPVDLAQQVLARIRVADPEVGAYTVVLEESVLDEAERAAKRIAQEARAARWTACPCRSRTCSTSRARPPGPVRPRCAGPAGPRPP